MAPLVGSDREAMVERDPAPDQGGPASPTLDELIGLVAATGIEVDADEAVAWLTAVAAKAAEPGEFTVGEGIGGHELAVLDFDPGAADRVRRLGEIVRTPSTPTLEAALAIAGSVAQNRVQPFPADVDFFERIHVTAAYRDEATRRLAEAVRADVVRVERIPGFALETVTFGRLPPRPEPGAPPRPDTFLRWGLADVLAGELLLTAETGRSVSWDEAATDPGFVKLTWLLADRSLGGPVWVSKVVDATWQSPDGSVVSLDGAIDADFQQVYLDAAGAALAQRLTGLLSAADRERYVVAMEREIVAYLRERPPNYGKVAKRLYNLCRLLGLTREALFLRELLDEPVARLYQARAPIGVIVAACERNPQRLSADLADFLADLAPTLCADAACAAAVAVCQEAVAGVDAAVLRTALARLDAVLGERVNDVFRTHLLGFAPTAQLLAELEARYPRG